MAHCVASLQLIVNWLYWLSCTNHKRGPELLGAADIVQTFGIVPIIALHK